MKTIKSFILISTLLLVNSCGRLNNDKIQQSSWKYGDGFHLGDVLSFDKTNWNNQNGFSLKGDTILFNGQPRALIIDCSKKKYKKKYTLTIKSLFHSRKKATYHEL